MLGAYTFIIPSLPKTVGDVVLTILPSCWSIMLGGFASYSFDEGLVKMATPFALADGL